MFRQKALKKQAQTDWYPNFCSNDCFFQLL